jgi:type II secretory pathway pseudopilin PulG
VLVMMIICTMLALAAPSLRGFFASRQTADAAAQVLSLVQFARAQAIAEGRTYRLNLDDSEHAYWLTAQTGGRFESPETEFGRRFLLPAGTIAAWEEPADAATRGWIALYPDGRAEAAILRLTGKQGEAFDIVCRSPAERFRVVEREEGEAP